MTEDGYTALVVASPPQEEFGGLPHPTVLATCHMLGKTLSGTYQEDAARQAEVVANNGLVEVMSEMLRHPERPDWLATRLEVTSMLRTDPSCAMRSKVASIGP